MAMTAASSRSGNSLPVFSTGVDQQDDHEDTGSEDQSPEFQEREFGDRQWWIIYQDRRPEGDDEDERWGESECCPNDEDRPKIWVPQSDPSVNRPLRTTQSGYCGRCPDRSVPLSSGFLDRMESVHPPVWTE